VTADPPFVGVFAGVGCSAGKKVIGGGAAIDPPVTGYAISSNRPLRPGDFGGDFQGWFGHVLRIDADAPVATVTMRLFAICAFVE
jgi:hypothetical protein